MRFHKYHALGNDYLVLHPQDGDLPVAADIRTICHRNFGLGSDGILYGPLPTDRADFGLRILNPDGSEAEKSGNGLRIFAKFLVQQSLVDEGAEFTVDTIGGVVSCKVEGLSISVEMGRVSFHAADVPVNGYSGEVLQAHLQCGAESLCFSAATIGNPHCVVAVDELNETIARRLGPLLEIHPAFPNRTNVQFLTVIDRQNIRIEIWERGAGYTLASGSSSSAAGAVARRMGWVDAAVAVHMPGGVIQLQISDDYAVRMRGPATRVGEFILDPTCLTSGQTN